MSEDLLDRWQYEEAVSDDPEASIRAAIDASVVNLHTTMPGKVVWFDGSKQTAVVRPGIKRYFRGQGWKVLPDLMDVPVQFPRGGDFVLTFPVRDGDECMIHFAERAIDTWFASGGEQVPHSYRTHDLSDAFAQVGVSSVPHVVSDFNSSAVELRRLDGKAKIQIDGQDIAITSETGNVAVNSAPSGTISLNAPPGATPMMNGVILGSHLCPITGLPHSSSGPPSFRVLVGST
jgi:hypothetical protein